MYAYSCAPAQAGQAVLRYYAETESMYLPDVGHYQTFCLALEIRKSRQWEPAGIIHDVTTDPHLAMRMGELFTAHQLSPLHLRDAVEDMLP